MKRKIIHIDRDLCNGCGACAAACHEGAIEMVGGKAVLTREDYCDGLGDCLPACPTGAITFEEREAPAYNERGSCTGRQGAEGYREPQAPGASPPLRLCPLMAPSAPVTSRLSQWPVQIKLVPVNAPYFDGANLLIAADCTAYAYGNIHEEFIKGRVTLIGCPTSWMRGTMPPS